MPSQHSPRFNRSSLRLILIFSLTAAGLLVVANPAHAQVTIDSVTTSTNTSAPNSTDTGTTPSTITFQNDIRAVTAFNAGGMDYVIQSTATNAYVRRNTGVGNSNRSIVWEQNAGAANTVVGTDSENFASMLLDNNLYQGAGNLFSNGTGTLQSNIERVDFVWSGGVSVLASDGFAVFDLNGTQDGFQIALITGLGTGIGAPTTWTFTNALEVANTTYGSSLDLNNSGGADAVNFRVLQYNNGNNISNYADASSVDTQNLAGAFIRLSDLGIADGTTIYGYALMAADVTNTGANLANWNNAANYSTGTNATIGGLDLAAFNGQLGRNVPEPATYGAILLFFTVATVAIRRRQVAVAVKVRR